MLDPSRSADFHQWLQVESQLPAAKSLQRATGVEKGNSGVCKADIQQRKETRAMLKIEMALQRGSLGDLVPEVLDVAVPELADLSLFRMRVVLLMNPRLLTSLKTSV